VISRKQAEALDASDVLAPWREEFVTHDDSLRYLDGNSLGMMPRRTLAEVQRVMEEEWATGLIRSWDDWVDLPMRVGDELAPLLGASPGEVVVHDSTTVNLYQLVHAARALQPERRVLAVDPSEFPTDRYVVDGIAAATGCEVRAGFDRLDDVAVVVRSLVDYRTAEVADLAGETARARAAGALTIWDLSHAAGVLQLDLHAAGVQLAVGCTYKFLNGGPGAPAFSFVAPELLGAVRQPIWGWFGAQDLFAMGPQYEPRDDIGRLLLGTPGILGLVAARVGIGVTVEAGIGAIHAKARRLTGIGLMACDDHRLVSPTPREPHRRGGHVSVQLPDAKAVVAALRERGILADFREPDLVRLGCSPLTTRFVDVADAVSAIAEITGRR
jgi:kynureninase